MPRYVALLRGINVGGHHKVPMADLRALLTADGLEDVRTVIASGNVAFDAPEAPVDDLQARLAARIGTRFGFDVPVVVRPQVLLQALDAHPHDAPSLDPRFLHVLFADGVPDPAGLDRARDLAEGDEQVDLHGTEVFVHYAHGSARSPLTLGRLERAFGVGLTGRNWKTVARLRDL